MESESRGGEHKQLEEHSLPGTNQAAKGPGSCAANDRENSPDRGRAHDHDELERHSLPGTNQAGKEVGQTLQRDHS
jgi:hypothetical protein